MSPHVANKFAGHLARGDPRSPLFAAAACDWPTVPAFRYSFTSDDATGRYAFLRTEPPLLEFNLAPPAHDYTEWHLMDVHTVLLAGVAFKLSFAPWTTWLFGYAFTFHDHPEVPLSGYTWLDAGPCNVTIALPRVIDTGTLPGDTGETFRAEQVVWDQEAPPPDPGPE